MAQGRTSQTFLADPTALRGARRFVAAWLHEHSHDELVDRATLAVSELAANAVVHTARPFTVTLDSTSALLRIEVVDSAPDRLAVRVPMSGSAVDITSSSTTGRGLQIVSSLANRWGVDLRSNVKTIWCEFDAEAPTAPSDPVTDDRRPQPPRPSDVTHLRFLGLPVRTAIASGLDVDDAIRDLQMHKSSVDAEVEDLLSLVDRSAPLRLGGRHAALYAAGQGRLTYDLEVDATDDELGALADLNKALAQLPLTAARRPPADDVVAFRTWLSDETSRQLRGEPPSPFPDSDADEWLWEDAGRGYGVLTPDAIVLRANAAMRAWLELDPETPRRIVSMLGAAAGLSAAPLVFTRKDGRAVQTRLSARHDGRAIRVVIAEPDETGARTAELVRALQQTLIPPAPPFVAGLDVAAAYLPALGDVGGDFFDVFEVAAGDWCVVLGDVSGKGVEAAIVTAEARHAVRSAALREPVPSDLMRSLNKALVETGGTRFCTVALLRLQLVGGAWVATFTSAGHPYPLLIRHGTATKLGAPGSLLGVFDEVHFHDVSIKLSVGDALVLYTDGVIEARNAKGEFYGDERMCPVLTGAAHSAQAMVDELVNDVLDFQTGPSDDIAVVVIRRPEL